MLAAAIAIVGFLAAGAGYWAYIRPTRITFPYELTETVEAESFRNWLGTEDDGPLIWGREFNGRYYVVATGALAARAIWKKARSDYSNSTMT